MSLFQGDVTFDYNGIRIISQVRLNQYKKSEL